MIPNLCSLYMTCRSFEIEYSLKSISLSDWRLTGLSIWHEGSQVLYCTLAKVLESICCPLLPLYFDFFVDIRAFHLNEMTLTWLRVFTYAFWYDRLFFYLIFILIHDTIGHLSDRQPKHISQVIDVVVHVIKPLVSNKVTTYCEFFHSVFILKILATFGLAKLNTFKLFLETVSNQRNR